LLADQDASLRRLQLATIERTGAEMVCPPGPTYERSGYVVVDPMGRRYHPDTVSDYWAAACAKAGVKRIRLHDARHTSGTLMHLERNVPVAIISAWLGHADTAFTMRTLPTALKPVHAVGLT
jgi:integrase